jgi:hypothetical protein
VTQPSCESTLFVVNASGWQPIFTVIPSVGDESVVGNKTGSAGRFVRHPWRSRCPQGETGDDIALGPRVPMMRDPGNGHNAVLPVTKVLLMGYGLRGKSPEGLLHS